ncbi:MAG: AmmeMemoRadiSam system protein B [bacterium]
MSIEKPRLRNVELLPAPDGDGLFIRDPLGVCEQTLVLSPGAVRVLPWFDGEHSVRDIQFEVARGTGGIVHSEQLEKLIAALDEHLLLEGARFDARFAEIVREFHEAPVRRAAHAGQSYPADAAELRAWLAAFYVDPRGPGVAPIPPSRAGAQRTGGAGDARYAGDAVDASAASQAPSSARVRAIVAPHIDLRAGGPCIAHAYKALLESTDARTFVILGVAHAGAENLFAATRKDFATPLGVTMTDHEFLDDLARNLPFDITADEFAHRTEHSIEFPVLFLQQILGLGVTIVPILVGGFEEMLAAGKRPEEDARVAALGGALTRRGDDVAVIASVDLAHIGARFGDSRAIDADFLAYVEREDRAFLDAAAARDPDALLAAIAKDFDSRRVDGFPAIYTLLRALPLAEGKLLRYEQHADEKAQSAVTFASLAFS